MDRREAGEIADAILADLRTIEYSQLVSRLLGDVETRVVAGPSGVEYQAEIEGMWDAARSDNLLVMVTVDDGTLRGAFRPETRDVIVAPDGTFVGKP